MRDMFSAMGFFRPRSSAYPPLPRATSSHLHVNRRGILSVGISNSFIDSSFEPVLESWLSRSNTAAPRKGVEKC